MKKINSIKLSLSEFLGTYLGVASTYFLNISYTHLSGANIEMSYFNDLFFTGIILIFISFFSRGFFYLFCYLFGWKPRVFKACVFGFFFGLVIQILLMYGAGMW